MGISLSVNFITLKFGLLPRETERPIIFYYLETIPFLYNQKRAFPRSLLGNNRVRLWYEQVGRKSHNVSELVVPLRQSYKV